MSCPQPHHSRGARKERDTSSRYKRVTRMFKTARNHFVESNALPNGTAPSYFVECFLCNVPNVLFGSSLGETYVEVVNWLLAEELTDLSAGTNWPASSVHTRTSGRSTKPKPSSKHSPICGMNRKYMGLSPVSPKAAFYDHLCFSGVVCEGPARARHSEMLEIKVPCLTLDCALVQNLYCFT